MAWKGREVARTRQECGRFLAPDVARSSFPIDLARFSLSLSFLSLPFRVFHTRYESISDAKSLFNDPR